MICSKERIVVEASLIAKQKVAHLDWIFVMGMAILTAHIYIYSEGHNDIDVYR